MSLWKCSNCCLLNSCTAQHCQACFSPEQVNKIPKMHHILPANHLNTTSNDDYQPPLPPIPWEFYMMITNLQPPIPWECYNCGLRNSDTAKYCQACCQNTHPYGSDYGNDYTSDSSCNSQIDEKKISFEEFYYQKTQVTQPTIQHIKEKDNANELDDFIILLSHDTVLVILLDYMDCLSILNLSQSHILIQQQIIDRDDIKKILRKKYISSRKVECTSLADKSDDVCLSLLKVKLVVNKNIKRDDEQYGKSVLSKLFEQKDKDMIEKLNYEKAEWNSTKNEILENILQFPCCLPFDLTNPQVHSAILNYMLCPQDVSYLKKTDFSLEEPLFNQENLLYGENKKLLAFNEWGLNFDDILKFWSESFIECNHWPGKALNNLPKHFLESKTKSLQYFQLDTGTDYSAYYTSLFLNNDKLMMDIANICQILTQYNKLNKGEYTRFNDIYFGKFYDGQYKTMVKDATKNVLDLILPRLVGHIYETSNQWFIFDILYDFGEVGGEVHYLKDARSDCCCASLIESKKHSDITTDVYDLTYLVYSMRYYSCNPPCGCGCGW